MAASIYEQIGGSYGVGEAVEAFYDRDMRSAHVGRGITAPVFDTVVGHLAATLEGLGVPAATIQAIAGKLLPLRAEIVRA
jgi:truncated hemoglobin YjbI